MKRQDCRPAKDPQSEVFGWAMSIIEIPGAWISKNDPVLNRFHIDIDRGEAAMALDPCWFCGVQLIVLSREKGKIVNPPFLKN